MEWLREKAATVTEIVPEYRIACCDSGDGFTLREVDQRFYMERGFRRPRRCPPCRRTRKSTCISA
jgi:hypothetical protein